LPSPHFHITILIPIFWTFWPFMTVANKTGSDHTAGELAPKLAYYYTNHTHFGETLSWGEFVLCSMQCDPPSIS
jgi:hypothetical protein